MLLFGVILATLAIGVCAFDADEHYGSASHGCASLALAATAMLAIPLTPSGRLLPIRVADGPAALLDAMAPRPRLSALLG